MNVWTMSTRNTISSREIYDLPRLLKSDIMPDRRLSLILDHCFQLNDLSIDLRQILGWPRGRTQQRKGRPMSSGWTLFTNWKVCGAKICNKPTPKTATKKMRIATQRWQVFLTGAVLNSVVFYTPPPLICKYKKIPYQTISTSSLTPTAFSWFENLNFRCSWKLRAAFRASNSFRAARTIFL